MLIELLLKRVHDQPENIQFSEVIFLIDECYQFTETAFTNGKLHNAAGENSGSCKLLAFAQLQQLSPEDTLTCFGQYYRDDVLKDPEGDSHQNIRNFINTQWSGIEFSGSPLTLKSIF